MDQSPITNHHLNSLASLKRWQRPALLVGGIGLVLGVVGLLIDRTQFWQSYLLAYLFWLEIGLGGLGFVLLHHLVGGRWSARIRHIMEAAALTLGLMALLFVPLIFGLTSLYPWANAELVAESALLQTKTAWLNIPFFLGRALLYWVIWLGLVYALNRLSRRQAETGDPALAGRMRGLSAVGMILYMLSTTFAAYDWMMSLEPEWFSSIYGLLFLAGQGLAALTLAIIGLRMLTRGQPLSDDWRQSFNDLGNFLLGFVMIWAYFAYSQFLIIWSADLPEEIIWYHHRIQGSWLTVALVLVGVHFVLPFLLLLSRSLKRNVRWLPLLALLVFCARLIDLVWLIVPAFHPDGLSLHWLDGVLLVAIGGGWLAFFVGQWMSKPALPTHDPHVGERDEQHEELTPIKQGA